MLCGVLLLRCKFLTSVTRLDLKRELTSHHCLNGNTVQELHWSFYRIHFCSINFREFDHVGLLIENEQQHQAQCKHATPLKAMQEEFHSYTAWNLIKKKNVLKNNCDYTKSHLEFLQQKSGTMSKNKHPEEGKVNFKSTLTFRYCKQWAYSLQAVLQWCLKIRWMSMEICHEMLQKILTATSH